jgi:hypothetical protein
MSTAMSPREEQDWVYSVNTKQLIVQLDQVVFLGFVLIGHSVDWRRNDSHMKWVGTIGPRRPCASDIGDIANLGRLRFSIPQSSAACRLRQLVTDSTVVAIKIDMVETMSVNKET